MKSFAVLLAQSALTVGLLCGQPQSPLPEVSGTLLEPGTNQPIAGATIKLFLVPDTPPRLIGGGLSNPDQVAATDVNGVFSFQVPRLGAVQIRAEKEGFGPGAPMLQPPIEQASVTLDKDHPHREVHLTLARPAYLTAHVIDEETRRPAAGVKLAVFQAVYQGGARRLLPSPGSQSESDSEGRFKSGSLAPGQYVISVRPESQQDGLIKTTFSPKDFETVDHDLARTLWPGGHDQDTAIPVRVGSGETVDIGAIVVRQTLLYRVKVSLFSSTCAPGELVPVARVVRNGVTSNVGDIVNVPCRGEFLVTRLQPGTYWFEFASGKRPVSERERASVQVQVVDHNLAVKAALSRGIDIEGRFTVPEGSSKPDWTAVKLFSDPVGTIRVLDEMPEPPDAGGRFHLVNLAPRDHRFSVSGLPAGYYVQEVRYNGARMPDGWLALSAGAPGQSVEVLVGNTPAALTGTVKDGDSARVVLIHWPPNPAEIRHSTTTATADPDGKFQLTNLAPGDYRYFAVRAGAIDKLQEPYVMDHALQSARKLTLGPGIVQSIELEMIDP